MEPKHLVFSDERPGAASLLFKRAAARKHVLMGDMTVEEQRAAQQKLYEALPLSPDVRVLEADCAGVPCEWVWRNETGGESEKVLLYLHGGGWTMGNRIISRPAASILAEAASCKVLTVEYRLAPEYPFPAGLTDCRLVYGWLLGQGYLPENIALFGDSAGGNLALCLINLLLEEGADLPCAVGCASPVTDISGAGEIVRNPPPLAFAMADGARSSIFSLYAGGQNLRQALISPVYGDLSAFPPVLIHVGGDEPLSVDNAAFAKRAVGLGANVRCKIWRDMFHDFSIVGAALKESRQSMAEFAGFYNKFLHRGGPFFVQTEE